MKRIAFALAILAMLAIGQAQSAQNFYAFTDRAFERLVAYDINCQEFGLDGSAFPFSRCGFINDDLTDLNKSIVDSVSTAGGLTRIVDWEVLLPGAGIRQWQAGYGTGRKQTLMYVVNYIESDSTPDVSIVWFAAQLYQ